MAISTNIIHAYDRRIKKKRGLRRPSLFRDEKTISMTDPRATEELGRFQCAWGQVRSAGFRRVGDTGWVALSGAEKALPVWSRGNNDGMDER